LAVIEKDSWRLAAAIEHFAIATCLRNADLVRGARLTGYSEAILLKSAFRHDFTLRTTHKRLTMLLEERLPEDVRRLLMAEGAVMSGEAAIASALGDDSDTSYSKKAAGDG
jgi:hypothetical protein